LTDVLSASWDIECDDSQTSQRAIVDATELIFQTAAAAGVTVSIAAGDQGSSGCASREPPFEPSHLAISYPGSSPWVTSVGGTNLELHPDDTIRDVRVWNDWSLQLDQALPHQGCVTPPCRLVPVWAGAGGESLLFPRPAWQDGPGVPPGSSRLVPDVAFLADIYPGTAMRFQGAWRGGNGTSQAAPIFAALTILLNEHNARLGRPRTGFANPLLYDLAARRPEPFFDVVEGDNVIGDQEMLFDVDCCSAGPDYDLASGWGSLLLDRAVAALANRTIAAPGTRRLPGRLRHTR
jgi:kumamolisin